MPKKVKVQAIDTNNRVWKYKLSMKKADSMESVSWYIDGNSIRCKPLLMLKNKLPSDLEYLITGTPEGSFSATVMSATLRLHFVIGTYSSLPLAMWVVHKEIRRVRKVAVVPLSPKLVQAYADYRKVRRK